MLKIRNAHEEDAEIIVHFQMEMAYETEQVRLDKEQVSEGVLNVLRDVQKGRYFLAQWKDKVAGSLLITTEWSDWRNQWVLWIQSVYVLPEYRRKGIFKSLYNHVKSLAMDDKEVAGLRLYVDKSNDKAIEVYKKLGMDGDHYRVFEWMKGRKE